MGALYSWQLRIERAESLALTEIHARDMLVFYAEVLKWQSSRFQILAGPSVTRKLTGHLDSDQDVLLADFDSLLQLISRKGSEALARQAAELASGNDGWKELLASYRNGEPDCAESFFARACLQPYLELLADLDSAPARPACDATQPQTLCPFCSRKPQLAILSSETSMPGTVEGGSEGGRRYLMCGDCQTVWPFQRLVCADCREDDPRRLACYSAQEYPAIRVECCDACRQYIKAIDLTTDNRQIPPVDEMASIPLDLWARNEGYTKIQTNLAGL